jgi:hypothetical protein
MTATEKKTKVKRRRRRRGKGSKKNYYFTDDTQNAIVEHQQSEDDDERHRIYKARIHPAFDKLVENLINIHKFQGQYSTREELRADCVAFLYESIHKFDHTRGTKAFSYFNIVAKHWLIIRSKKRVERQRRLQSMDAYEGLSAIDLEKVEQHSVVPPQDEILIGDERSNAIITLLQEIRGRLKSANELACIDSIITLFEMSEHLDLLNKSAVLTYLREMTSLSPKQLTMTLYSIKKHYRELKGDDRFDLFG